MWNLLYYLKFFTSMRHFYFGILQSTWEISTWLLKSKTSAKGYFESLWKCFCLASYLCLIVNLWASCLLDLRETSICQWSLKMRRFNGKHFVLVGGMFLFLLCYCEFLVYYIVMASCHYPEFGKGSAVNLEVTLINLKCLHIQSLFLFNNF